MKNIQLVIFAGLIVVAGCKTPVNIEAYRENAETATQAGDYVIALEAWKMYFEQLPAGNEPEGPVYARAAHTAYQASDTAQTITWFEQARRKGYDDPSMYLTLAEIYRHQGDIQNELSALERFREKTPREDLDVNTRLFSIYYTTNQHDKAVDAWEDMPDTQKRTAENLERYLDLNMRLKNESLIDSVSLELLKVAPEHLEALEWQAQINYEKGEARYQREMKQYEAKPTSGNYQTLLRGLKAASVDFRKSLQYFEKLWDVNPENRDQYAVYMNNIHVRFNDKEKADYYRKFIK